MNKTHTHEQALRSLSIDFLTYGLDWCLIKWPDDGREHGDLDVLAKDHSLHEVVELAERHGFSYDPDPDRYRRKYIKQVNGHRVELDIHTEAAWVGIKYLEKNWIIDNATPREIGGSTIPVPHKEADLLIWAAHCMRNNEITYWDVKYCYRLLEECDLPECVMIADTFGWKHQFNEFVDLVRRLHGYPESCFPYNQPFLTSFKMKAGKVATTLQKKGVVSALYELQTLRKFDL